MELTTEQVKDISVRVVENFVNNKISLNEGIAKQASEMELNPDQIKRVIETSNTIAYLKLQKEASDKTFEFPVADYDKIMQTVCLPSDVASVVIEKQAEIKEVSEDYVPTEMVEQEQRFWLNKMAANNRVRLADIEIEKAGLLYSILETTEKLRKDDKVIEKLAEVCDEVYFVKLAHLVKGAELPTLRNDLIIRDNELVEVRHLLNLYKQAQKLKAEEETCIGLNKRALLEETGRFITGAPITAATAMGKATGKSIKKSFGHIGGIGGSLAAAVTTKIPEEHKIWNNLQGSMKRF